MPTAILVTKGMNQRKPRMTLLHDGDQFGDIVREVGLGIEHRAMVKTVFRENPWQPATPQSTLGKPAPQIEVFPALWIQGEGRPRKYALRGTFVVDSIGPDTDDGFRFIVRGREGELFRPPIPIGTLPWFHRFKQTQGNFAFGLQRISDEAVVDELNRICGGALEL